MTERQELKELKEQALIHISIYQLVIIGTDDTIKVETVTSDKVSLEYVQEKVGGLIDIVPSKFFKNHYVICNDEGRLLNLPYNSIATNLLGYYLVGNIVIVRRNLFE